MEISQKTKEYWQEQDWKDLETAESVKDLYKIAERIIERMPKPLVEVCGPISEKGGLGSIEANLNAFNQTVLELQNKGLNVFDQMPFEDTIQVLKKKPSKNGGFFDNLLIDFYYPIFASGHVSAFYFMPNWQTSFGAKAEHDKAKELGIEIVYL